MKRFNLNDLMMGIAHFTGSELVWKYSPNEFQRFFYEMGERLPEVFGGIDFEERGDGTVFSPALNEQYQMTLRAGLIKSVNGNGTVHFHPAGQRFYQLYTRAKFSGKGSKSLVGALREASQEFAYRFGADGK